MHLFSKSIDKSSILAESTMKGKEYYCTGKKFFKKSILEIKNQALLLPVGYFSLAVCDF